MGIQYRSSRKCRKPRREPRRRLRRRRLLTTDHLKSTRTTKTRRTSLVCATSKRHLTTLSFTLPISQAEKPTRVSLLTSSKTSRSLASTLSTSSSEAWVESRRRHQDQEPSQRSEHLLETDLRSAGLRMSLLLPPIQPEEEAAAEEEDFERMEGI